MIDRAKMPIRLTSLRKYVKFNRVSALNEVCPMKLQKYTLQDSQLSRKGQAFPSNRPEINKQTKK